MMSFNDNEDRLWQEEESDSRTIEFISNVFCDETLCRKKYQTSQTSDR